jgi:hypothetical protein
MNPIGSVGFALTSALALSTPLAATGLIETAAHCHDGSSIQSNQGSSVSATCSRGVSEFGPPYRIGGTNAQALVTSSLSGNRFKQGVSAAAATILSTNGPEKIFGAAAYVSVLDADWFTTHALDHTNLAITGGQMVVNLRLRGSLLLSGVTDLDSFARLRHAVVLENKSGELAQARGDLLLDSPGVQAVDQQIAIPVAWLAGDRIDFSMTMIADGQALIDRTGSAKFASSFASSLEWLGIDRVTDENGVPVASFLAMNPETGVNWGVPSPVPDPAVWVLLGAGLPLVALRCRQRRPDRGLLG